MKIPQTVKCLLGFHAWMPWRFKTHDWYGPGMTVTYEASRVCGTCGKIQRRTR